MISCEVAECRIAKREYRIAFGVTDDTCSYACSQAFECDIRAGDRMIGKYIVVDLVTCLRVAFRRVGLIVESFVNMCPSSNAVSGVECKTVAVRARD